MVAKRKTLVEPVVGGVAQELPLPVAKAFDYLKQTENTSFYYHFLYGIIDLEGQNFPCGNFACHAEMGYPKVADGKRGAVWSMWPKLKGDKAKPEGPAHTQWADWVVNRSPWKDAFYPADAQFVIDRGVVGRVDVGGQYLVNALMATRIHCEHEAEVHTWHKFVEAGMSEDIAYMFTRAGVSKKGILSETCSSQGHHPFQTFLRSHAENFLLRKHPGQVAKTTYQNASNYRPCTDLWTGNFYGDVDTAYSRFLVKTYPSEKIAPSNRMFDVEEVPYGKAVQHTVAEWVKISKQEHERITGNVEKVEEAAKPRRRRKAEAA